MTGTTANKVLFVDDSTNLLSAVRRSLRGKAELVVAESAADALKVLACDNNISIVITDQNMPGMKGMDFLEEVAREWPQIIRIMQTGNQDQETAITAINKGPVFRFLRKPYEPETLQQVITEAQVAYDVRQAEQILLETTLAGSIKMLTEMLALMRPDLFAEATQVRQIAGRMARELKVPNVWELDLAAMLYPIGLMTVPEAVLVKRRKGQRLESGEAAQLMQSGQIGGELIARIPRLGNVAQNVSLCRKGFDGSGFPKDGASGKDIPLSARILHILIDTVELAALRQISFADSAQALKSHQHSYDPELLQLISASLKAEAEAGRASDHSVAEVSVYDLETGDVIVSDLMNNKGELLLAGGVELSLVMVKRLQRLVDDGQLKRYVPVLRSQNPARSA